MFRKIAASVLPAVAVAAAAAVAALTAGCASSLGTFYNRPVVEDKVGETLSTVSLSADRRTIVVSQLPPGSPKPLYCAEPPPDTATGLKTSLDTSLKLPAKGDASLKDTFEGHVTVLAARNAPLDAFRTGVFSLCQYYMNGAIKAEDVRPMFERLVTMFEATQSRLPAVVAPAAPASAPSGR
jgi:hypothetical protein